LQPSGRDELEVPVSCWKVSDNSSPRLAKVAPWNYVRQVIVGYNYQDLV